MLRTEKCSIPQGRYVYSRFYLLSLESRPSSSPFQNLSQLVLYGCQIIAPIAPIGNHREKAAWENLSKAMNKINQQKYCLKSDDHERPVILFW